MNGSLQIKTLVAPMLVAGIVTSAATSPTTASRRGGDGGVPPAPGIDRDLDLEVNELLGLRVSTVQSLELQPGPGGGVTTQVTIDGDARLLEFGPSTVRSADYEVLVQRADGTLESVEPSPERTLRGILGGVPGSIASGALLDDGLYASVLLPDGRQYWVEPVSRRLGVADESLHVVYDSEDVLATGGLCGADARHEAFFEVPEQMAAGGVAGEEGEICETELACDADVEYFNDWGSVQAVEDRINLIIATVNLQYEAEVGITHVIATIIVRTAEPDPYSTSDPGGLLGQLSDHWEANHTDIQRDVVHLFTGKDLSGNVIGIAWVPGVCNDVFAYGVAQSDYNGNFDCATDLTAHEIGHNWGALHCDCPGTTMHPSIQCANTFSQTSINSIVSYRDSLTCVDCTGPLAFSYPEGRPTLIDPAGGTTVRVIVEPGNASPQPGTGLFHLRVNGGSFVVLGMTEGPPNEYTAVFPPLGCGDIVEYYFSAQATTGAIDTSPPTAPGGAWSAISGLSLSAVFNDDFEADLGWTVQSGGATDGQWERADPISNEICDRGNPGADADGSGFCYVTDNDDLTCNSDVDGGSTILLSPILDASGGDIVTYWRWFDNSGAGGGANPFEDIFRVEVSENGGASWVPLETVGPDGPEVEGGWVEKSFNIAQFVTPNEQFRIRFIAEDVGGGSIVEAGVDGLRIRSVECASACPWDCDGSSDGIVSVADLLALLGQYDGDSPVNCTGGACDFNGDGCVDVADLLKLLSHYDPEGAGCPQ